MKSNERSERFEVKERRSTIDALILDIWALDRLIKKRQEWLNRPENKMRSTYCAIAADTQRMVERLNFLKRELDNETKP